MPPSPIVLTERLHTREAPESALCTIGEVARSRGGKVDQLSATTLVARLGSRWTYRLWGIFGPGARHLPIVLRIEAAPGTTGALLDVEMASDEGCYPLRTQMAATAYRERFADILTDLRRAGIGGA